MAKKQKAIICVKKLQDSRLTGFCKRIVSRAWEKYWTDERLVHALNEFETVRPKPQDHGAPHLTILSSRRPSRREVSL